MQGLGCNIELSQLSSQFRCMRSDNATLIACLKELLDAFMAKAFNHECIMQRYTLYIQSLSLHWHTFENQFWDVNNFCKIDLSIRLCGSPNALNTLFS